jgi:hypothetical protein
MHLKLNTPGRAIKKKKLINVKCLHIWPVTFFYFQFLMTHFWGFDSV